MRIVVWDRASQGYGDGDEMRWDGRDAMGVLSYFTRVLYTNTSTLLGSLQYRR